MAAILAEQLALDLQDLADDVTPSPANDDAPSSTKTGSRNARSKPKRNIGALPKDLSRCEVIIEPESTVCPCCAGKLHRIGEDVSEALTGFRRCFGSCARFGQNTRAELARKRSSRRKRLRV